MNVWPDGENFLRPSFNPPVEAPASEPDAGALITVKYNPDWTRVLLGAVDQLRQYAALVGDHDTKIVTVERVNTLMALLQTDTTEAETPYWDDASDVEDSEPVDMQPWYGEVTNPTAPPDELDFVENLLVWTFTGLLALATPEFGFAPAILFHTIAPKFLIAQKAGDVGEIVNIVIDGKSYGSVDTTGRAGEIIETPVIADPSLDTHEILIYGMPT